MQGVKLVNIEVVHGVLICPFTEMTRRTDIIAINWGILNPSMNLYQGKLAEKAL